MKSNVKRYLGDSAATDVPNTKRQRTTDPHKPTDNLSRELDYLPIGRGLLVYLFPADAARFTRCNKRAKKAVEDWMIWSVQLSMFIASLNTGDAACLCARGSKWAKPCHPELPGTEPECRAYISQMLQFVHVQVEETMTEEAETNKGKDGDDPSFTSITPVIVIKACMKKHRKCWYAPKLWTDDDDYCPNPTHLVCHVDFDSLDPLYGKHGKFGEGWQWRILEWYRKGAYDD